MLGKLLVCFMHCNGFVDMQFNSVDFMVDSKVTADAFNSHRHDATEFDQVIIACQNIFSSSSANSRVEFSRRQANVASFLQLVPQSITK